jgi:hypothetical protein
MPLRASEHAYQTSERASGLALGPDWPRFFEEDSYRVPRGGSNRLTRERKRERERERERKRESRSKVASRKKKNVRFSVAK